nr:translation initiation factor IF-2-like [Aegilops tauschii subsp. strangulata]
MAAAALCTAQEEAERIIRERQAASRKPCRDTATFRRPKPDDDDDDDGSGADDGGAADQPDMAYEVTVKPSDFQKLPDSKEKGHRDGAYKKDTVSTDAATVSQYKIGQVMNPSTSTRPMQPSSVNHQRPPTRVAMAARPHPRRKSRPRTSCLPTPGPPSDQLCANGRTRPKKPRHTSRLEQRRSCASPHMAGERVRRGSGCIGAGTSPCQRRVAWARHHIPVPATGGPGSAVPPVPPAYLPTEQLGVAPPRRRPQLHARPTTYTRPPARRDPKGRHQSRRKLTEEPICAARCRPAAEASDPGQPAHRPTAPASHHHPSWPWQGQRPAARAAGPQIRPRPHRPWRPRHARHRRAGHAASRLQLVASLSRSPPAPHPRQAPRPAEETRQPRRHRRLPGFARRTLSGGEGEEGGGGEAHRQH